MTSDVLQRPASFFQARDRFDATLDAGELNLSRPALTVLRYLLEHAWYSPRDPEDYGMVTEDAISNDVIARRTGYGLRAIEGIIPELVRSGFIVKQRRPVLSGGREADLIVIAWLTEPAETAVYEPAETAASSSTKRNQKTHDGTAAHTATQEDQERAGLPGPTEYAQRLQVILNDEIGNTGSAEYPWFKLGPYRAAVDAFRARWADPADVPAVHILDGIFAPYMTAVDTETGATVFGKIGDHNRLLGQALRDIAPGDIDLWIKRADQLAERIEQVLAEDATSTV
jgi:hypothetical protein